jgi:hypothetical protein
LQRERLHLTYRSAFPAGAYRVLVVWEVTTTRGLRGPTGRGFPVPGDVTFQLSTTFPVTISPATPANRWALAARLEAEFAALPPPVTDKGLRDYHFDNLCEKVICTPHKELVPLAFRLLERYPQGWGRSAPGWLSNDGLAETIFQADPATAHRLFVDRLITSPPRMNPILAFWIWWEPVGKFTQISDRFFAVFKPEFLTQPEYWHLWNPMRDLGDLIAWSRDAAARRLPDVELRRLAAAKDPEVRRLVERYFGTRLESK